MGGDNNDDGEYDCHEYDELRFNSLYGGLITAGVPFYRPGTNIVVAFPLEKKTGTR